MADRRRPSGYTVAARAGETMSESSEIRRKRLRFRSWHRGTREMDLLLGAFADAHLEGLSDDQLGRYEALLELSDPDLFAWIRGREAVPPAYDNDVFKLLQDFKFRA